MVMLGFLARSIRIDRRNYN